MINIRVRTGEVKFMAAYGKDKKWNTLSFNSLVGVAGRGK